MTGEGVGPQHASPPVGATLRAAWAIVRERPRQVMLPLLVIQVPLTILAVVASAVLYQTVFSDEEYPEGGLMGSFQDLRGDELFAVLLLFGASFLFSTVGHGATVMAAAGAARGEDVSLTEALDPAFTRIGGLLVTTLIVATAAGFLAATVIGIVVLPYLVLRVGLWLHVYMLEDVGALDAIGRSWSMMQGHMLRLLGVLLVSALLATAVLLILAVPIVSDDAARGTRIAVDSIVELVRGTLLVPAVVFFQVAITIYYLGVKSRYEQQQRPA